MIQIIMKPQLHTFSSFSEFAAEFQPNERDLVLANKYIYEPHFIQNGFKTQVMYKSDYGKSEPTNVMVERMMKDAARLNCDRIIAIGGGSIIDIAKVLAVAGDESIDQLYDMAPTLTKRRKLVIIPTTCGTGSEVTNISVINRTRLGTKMGLVGPAMFADDAVLIPELLAGLPFDAFATSSIDALVHAVESALSPKATHYTKIFSYKAIEMILCGYQEIVRQGRDARNRLMEDFLIASNYAGLAFGTAGCAAVHATAYPLGGKYHVPHGESNYAMFTGVLNGYMRIERGGELAVMNRFLANLLACDEAVVYPQLERLLNQILPKKSLHEFGVTKQDLPEFAKSVVETQGRLMGNSFVPLDYEHILKIYSELY